MKMIPLTKGMVALVDDADYDFINQWKWHSHGGSMGLFYAARKIWVNGKGRCLFMHRVLSGAAMGQLVDHLDHCTLNNQRPNLRVCNQSQNQANSKKRSDNASGQKGVYQQRGCHKWLACIAANGKSLHLGTFPTKEEAAKAYDNAAKNIFGEFALTNQMEGRLN